MPNSVTVTSLRAPIDLVVHRPGQQTDAPAIALVVSTRVAPGDRGPETKLSEQSTSGDETGGDFRHVASPRRAEARGPAQMMVGGEEDDLAAAGSTGLSPGFEDVAERESRSGLVSARRI